MVRYPGLDRKEESASLAISSANRRQGFTQVQGPRSVKPLLPALIVLRLEVITLVTKARVALGQSCGDEIGCLGISSPGLFILSQVSKSPPQITKEVALVG